MAEQRPPIAKRNRARYGTKANPWAPEKCAYVNCAQPWLGYGKYAYLCAKHQ